MSIFSEIFNTRKILVQDPTVPVQKVASEPVALKENFAAVRAATGPSSLVPRQATIKPGSVTLPETFPVKSLEKAEIEIVTTSIPVEVGAEIPRAQTEASLGIVKPITPIAELPPFVEQVPVYIKPENERSEFMRATKEQILQAMKSTPSRVLFDLILKDIKDLIDAGQDLDRLIQERKVGAEGAGKVGLMSKEVAVAHEQLMEKVSGLIVGLGNADGGGKDLDSELQAISSSYINSYNLVENLKNELVAAGSKIDNKFLVQIEARKREVKKMMAIIGGTEYFEIFKNQVRNREYAQAEYSLNNAKTDYERHASTALYRYLKNNPGDRDLIKTSAGQANGCPILTIITMLEKEMPTK